MNAALAIETMQQRTYIEDRAVALRGRRSMQGMARGVVAAIIVTLGTWGLAQAAAPAPPSYLAIERSIETIRKAWSSPGGEANPLASGWNALFDSLLTELKSYTRGRKRTGPARGTEQDSAGIDRARDGPVAAGRRAEPGIEAVASASSAPGLGGATVEQYHRGSAGNERRCGHSEPEPLA